MTDPNELVLQTIGDLELNRRYLTARIQQLEQELEQLRNGQPDNTPTKEAAPR